MRKFLKKIRELFKTDKSESDIADLPHEYSFCDHYINSEKVEVIIRVIFDLPSVVKNFNLNDHPFYIRQQGSEIHVSYHKHISSTLLKDLQRQFDDFKNGRLANEDLTRKNPSQYIVGFLEDIIPRINKKISFSKYREGHLVLKTISQFDLKSVFVIDSTGKTSVILWPLPLPSLEEVPETSDVIFMRDLIDAMSEYFYFNFDDSIRKVITSLENFFIYYNLQPAVKTKKKNLNL